jgi:hypothetical protein
MTDQRIVACTGPVDIQDVYDRSLKIVSDTLGSLKRPDLLRSGGAYGIDSVFAVYARRILPEVPLELVLPDALHNEGLVRELQRDPFVTVRVIHCPTNWSNGQKYMARNDALVEGIAELCAFPYTDHEPINPRAGGGTWATVRRARRQNAKITINALRP